MSSRTNSDLGEYFRLNISFGPEEGITVQTIKTSDAARGLRQIKTTKTWKRVKEIGRGGFGAVWLENTNDELIEQRAVKEISKNASSASSKIDYNRELEALALLSNVGSSMNCQRPSAALLWLTNCRSTKKYLQNFMDGTKTSITFFLQWNFSCMVIWENISKNDYQRTRQG